ncbi:MAG: hypothetical protein ACFFD4_02290 [Candidatus Odinarchaeota archaeon]
MKPPGIIRSIEWFALAIFNDTSDPQIRETAKRGLEQFLSEADEKTSFADTTVQMQPDHSLFWKIHDSCLAIVKNKREGEDFDRAKWFIEAVSPFIERK